MPLSPPPPVTAPPAAPLTSRHAPRHLLTKEAGRPCPTVGPSLRLPSAAAGPRRLSLATLDPPPRPCLLPRPDAPLSPPAVEPYPDDTELETLTQFHHVSIRERNEEHEEEELPRRRPSTTTHQS
nr:unnamed protein product [Digitaria exilis]